MKKESEQHEIARKLVAALKGGEFVLHSQAIRPIGPASGRASYQEILVRFQEEERNLLPPGGFFPILEQHRLMTMLDRWVVSHVIRWLAARHRASDRKPDAAHCTVNLSSESITATDFADFVARQLKESKVPPQELLFEISEEDVNQHALPLDEIILPLKPLGCGFVVTGYSGELVSAEMLQALGISLVKIDGHIVRRIHEDEESLARAGAIHESCREIGIRTIAELVEHRETLDKLGTIGIDYAQGYGIAKPSPLK